MSKFSYSYFFIINWIIIFFKYSITISLQSCYTLKDCVHTFSPVPVSASAGKSSFLSFWQPFVDDKVVGLFKNLTIGFSYTCVKDFCGNVFSKEKGIFFTEAGAIRVLFGWNKSVNCKNWNTYSKICHNYTKLQGVQKIKKILQWTSYHKNTPWQNSCVSVLMTVSSEKCPLSIKNSL